MTRRSQNGWPVVGKSKLDTADIIPGIKVPGGVLKGDVAIVLRYVARLYNATVEPLEPGKCWGWEDRPVRGSAVPSNHGSGTAEDFNADEHNLGDPPSRSYTPSQIRACHAIEDACDNVVAWGGDWSRPDGMHFEIIGTPAEVAALARKIEEDDMPTVGDIWNGAFGKGSRRATPLQRLTRADENSVALLAAVKALTEQVAKLTAALAAK